MSRISRIRAILLSMGLIIVVLLAQSVSQAQAPGGAPGGGGAGGGGGGGRGGRGGGPGGPGGFGRGNRVSSPLTLASNTYVQEDMKLTDAQKDQVKALSDKYDEQRKALFPRRGRGGNDPAAKDAAAGQANTDAPKAATATTTAPNTKGQGGRTRGGAGAAAGDTANANNANGGGNRGGRGGNNGNGPNGGFNFGNGQGPGPDFAAMREKMDKLQAETEAALAKILTKPQQTRILQIQLRQEGPMAVTKPAMQKKLNMSDDQIAQIAEIMDERDSSQRELRNAGREMFTAFRTPDGQFDRAAMNAKMQDPQFKAQMDQMRKNSDQQRTQLEDTTIAMIGKTLTKKQHLAFQKMQGPPFDVAKLDRNYDPAAAAAKAKEQAEAAKEAANAKKGSSSKKKTSAKTKRS